MGSYAEPVPSIQVMSTTPRKTRREPRDTGFPEPFNDGRTTTLPHPDADLSPNACISQEDIAPELALSRTRRSFLKRKNRRTLGHGRSDRNPFSSVLSLTNPNNDREAAEPVSPSMSSIRLSRDDAESIISHRDEETPPTSPDVPDHRSKKGGFLKKWRKE